MNFISLVQLCRPPPPFFPPQKRDDDELVNTVIHHSGIYYKYVSTYPYTHARVSPQRFRTVISHVATVSATEEASPAFFSFLLLHLSLTPGIPLTALCTRSSTDWCFACIYVCRPVHMRVCVCWREIENSEVLLLLLEDEICLQSPLLRASP